MSVIYSYSQQYFYINILFEMKIIPKVCSISMLICAAHRALFVYLIDLSSSIFNCREDTLPDRCSISYQLGLSLSHGLAFLL